ncbi:hypothetical protein MtrunA17_Chr7g0241081 [Medicago truncatula]|nr:uncharacterized protein LOC120576820 [Medicago truncatula]RHN46330.1 hypothetical protein MtrunA17_Chr7g0241081 [Medicago truncatula]
MDDKNIPQQVAFIVDKYLLDNNFSSTRSTFRDEASSLIPKEQKSLITLDEMLDAYISLKEHKIMMDQEKFMLAQEKNQVQNLLQGLHDVMTTYNASGNLPSTSAKFALALVPQSVVSNKSQPGVPTSLPNISNTRSQPLSSNSDANGRNISTFNVNLSEGKRKETSAMDAPSAAKRCCSSLSPWDGHILLQQFDDIAFNNPTAI